MSNKTKKTIEKLLWGETPPEEEEGRLPPLPIFEPDFPVGPYTLQIESWNSSSETALNIYGYTTREYINEQHTMNTNRSKATTTHELLNPTKSLQIIPGGSIRRGETYVRASILVASRPVRILSSGYITDSKTIAWPPGMFEGFTEGPGVLKSLTGTNPSAGDNICESVPTNAIWKLRGFSFTFVTDATVADRRVAVILSDGTNHLVKWAFADVQAASLTHHYHTAEGYPNVPSLWNGINHTGFLPIDIKLFQGWEISTGTVNLQAGDQFNNIILFVEEWIEE